METIPSETIEQIAAANDIVEVIGAYFPLKRAGANFKALCPFHQEKTPSFHVSPQRQTFHCFGCGVGGSVFRFVMDYEHIDFPTAVRKLAARVGIRVIEERGPSGTEDRQHEARRTLLQLHGEAAAWFHENLIKKEFAQPARKYLKQRGITAEIAKRWQVGYAPDEWDAFGSWARGRGYDPRDLIISGLVKTKDDTEHVQDETSNAKRMSYDRFRGRIMFPICNDVGEVIAFSGRILQNDVKGPKYLNSPETPLFRKASVLFGLNKTKRALIEANCAIVCEGQLDLITLFEAGITNVVAPQGTAFTESQARVLKRFVNEVVLCFDADAAGKKAAERSLEALLQNDLIVRVVEMPLGEDPDSLVRREGKEEFEKRVTAARDFFDYWIEREAAATDLNSLGAKMQLARTLAELIGRIDNAAMRSEVIYKAAARLELPPADFENLVPRSAPRLTAELPRDMDSIWPSQMIKQLCVLALRDSEVREFLLAQEWREVLAHTPGAELLGRILAADVYVGDSATVASFLASLEPREEAVISGWIAPKRIAYTDRNLAHEWWNSLVAESVRRQLEALKNKMRLAELSTGDVVNLQKQILDLQEQLHELSEFSPVRAPGS
jgi:DNA primase